MTSSRPTVLELAKQGNAQAIAVLLGHSLKPKGVTVHAATDEHCLYVKLESTQPNYHPALIEFVRKAVASLEIATIHRLQLNGYETGSRRSTWEETIYLRSAADGMGQTTGDAPPVDDPTDDEGMVDAADEDAEAPTHLEPPSETLASATRTRAWGNLTAAHRAIAIAIGVALPLGTVTWFFWNSRALTTVESPEVANVTSAIALPSAPEAMVSVPSPPMPSPESAAAVVDAAVVMDEALQLGMTAAVDTQTAMAPAEWQKIATTWQMAIALLQEIPASDANYAIAQPKIQEYQRNMAYAQQRSQLAP